MRQPEEESSISEITTAKLFRNGRSQAVRLPKQFRFEGEAVRIRRVEDGVLLEPIHRPAKALAVDRWFAQLDKLLSSGEFMLEGREQPAMQEREFDL